MLGGEDDSFVIFLKLPHSPFDDLLYLLIEVEEWVIEDVNVCLCCEASRQGYLLEDSFWELTLVVYNGVEIVLKAKIHVQPQLVINFLDLSVSDGLVEESNVFLDGVLQEEKFLWEEGHFSCYLNLTSNPLQIAYQHFEERATARVLFSKKYKSLSGV